MRPRLEVLEDRLAPAVLTVNTTSDGNDPTVLSLRQAIQAVDSQSLAALSSQQQQQVSGNLGDNDQIQFAPGLTGIIPLQQGELDITQPVMISGPGAANLSIDGQGQSRVFAILTPGINVTLDGMQISGGMVSVADVNGSNGGGILNEGNLTLSNCILIDNSSTTSDGGGVYNDLGATLMVYNSNVSGNSAGDEGGGIFNRGSMLTISNSNLSGNPAGNYGGGIFNGFGSTMTVLNSTFFGNSAGIGGGGIDNDPGNLTVLNSTFSANSAGEAGGGIDNGSTLAITNSTFFGNCAAEGGALSNSGTATLTSVTVTGNVTGNVTGDQGGAVFQNPSFGTLLLDNTIVAGNFFGSPGGTPSDIVGTLDPNSSYNLIGTGGSGGLTDGVNHNLVGVSDPGLGSLADNGGPTQTCALLSSSPANGNGDPSLLGSTDQRDVVRATSVSIGAYQDPPTPGSVSGPFLGYPPWNPWNPGNPGSPHVGRMM
jgi:hypothetical protein